MVHRWRADLDAVAVGAGTFSADNPRLTARIEPAEGEAGRDEAGAVTAEAGPEAVRQPARVIFDSGPVVSPEAALFEDIESAPVILVTSSRADQDRLSRLEAAGAEILLTGDGAPVERFLEALDLLGARGISSLLLEGGPTLAGVALASGEVDRFEVFVAPILLGGGRAAVKGEGPLKMAEAIRAREMHVTRVGQDVHMSAQLKAW
jgi:diaminohydroxyphosphoribosylaminopyrimidine deaminase/5-amino-6-(5-phosphoribosylamino)uracil reductase